MILKIRLLLLFLGLALFSSCIYKMPTEDSYSLIPKTNNPVFIGEKDHKAMPNQATF